MSMDPLALVGGPLAGPVTTRHRPKRDELARWVNGLLPDSDSALRTMPGTLASDFADGHLLGLLMMQWGLMKRGEFKKFRKGRSNDIALHNYRMLEPIFRILRLDITPDAAAALIKGNQQAAIDLLVELKFMFEGRPARGPVFNQDFVQHKKREAGADGDARVGDLKSLDWMMKLQERVPPRQQETLHDRLQRTFDRKQGSSMASGGHTSRTELPGVYDHLPEIQRERMQQRGSSMETRKTPSLSELAAGYSARDGLSRQSTSRSQSQQSQRSQQQQQSSQEYTALQIVKPVVDARRGRGRPASAGDSERNAFIEILVQGFPVGNDATLSDQATQRLRQHFQEQHPDAGTAYRTPPPPPEHLLLKQRTDEDDLRCCTSEPLLTSPMAMRRMDYACLDDALLALQIQPGQTLPSQLGAPELSQPAKSATPQEQLPPLAPSGTDREWLEGLAKIDQQKWAHDPIADEPDDWGKVSGSVLNFDPAKLREKLGVSRAGTFPKRPVKSFEEQKKDKARIDALLKKHRERLRRIHRGKEKTASSAEDDLINVNKWMQELEEHEVKVEGMARETELAKEEEEMAKQSVVDEVTIGPLKRAILGESSDHYSRTEELFLSQVQSREAEAQPHAALAERRQRSEQFEQSRPYVHPHLLRQDHRHTKAPLSSEQIDAAQEISPAVKVSMLDRPTLKCDQLLIALEQCKNRTGEVTATQSDDEYKARVQETLQSRMLEMRLEEDKRAKTRKMLRPRRRSMPMFMREDPDNVERDTEEWSEAQHACIQEKLQAKRADKAESIRNRRFYLEGLHNLVQKSQRQALQEDITRCRVSVKCAAQERVENRMEEMSKEAITSILAMNNASAEYRERSHEEIMSEKLVRLERQLQREVEDFQNRVSLAVQQIESYRVNLRMKQHDENVRFCKKLTREIVDLAIRDAKMKKQTFQDMPELVKQTVKLLFMYGKPMFPNSIPDDTDWHILTKEEAKKTSDAVDTLLNEIDRKNYLNYGDEWAFSPLPVASEANAESSGEEAPSNAVSALRKIMHFEADKPGNFLMMNILRALEDWSKDKNKAKKPEALPPKVEMPRHRVRGVVLGKPFAGKTALLKRVREEYPLKIITMDYLVESAVKVFEDQKAEFAATMRNLRERSKQFQRERVERTELQNASAQSVAVSPDAALPSQEEALKSSASVATKSSKSVRLKTPSRPESVRTPATPMPVVTHGTSQVCPINGLVNLPADPEIEVIDPDFSGSWLKFSPRAVVGRKIVEYLAVGWSVPDKVLMELLAMELQTLDKDMGWILDGFPNTVKQAQMLVHVLTGYTSGDIQEGDSFGANMKFCPLDAKTPIVRVLSELLPNVLTGKNPPPLNSGLDFVVELEADDDKCCRRGLSHYYREFIRHDPEQMKEQFSSLLPSHMLPLQHTDPRMVVHLHKQMQHHALHSANLLLFFDTFGIVQRFNGNLSMDENYSRFKLLLDHIVGEAILQIKKAAEEAVAKKAAEEAARLKAIEEAKRLAETIVPESPPKTPVPESGGKPAKGKGGKGKASGKESGAKGEKSGKASAAKGEKSGKASAAKGGKASGKSSAAKGDSLAPNAAEPPVSREPTPPPQPVSHPFIGNYTFCTTEKPDLALVDLLLNLWRDMEQKYYAAVEFAFQKIRFQREASVQNIFEMRSRLLKRFQLVEQEDPEYLDVFSAELLAIQLLRRAKEAGIQKSDLHFAIQGIAADLLTCCDATAKNTLGDIAAWRRYAFVEDGIGYISNIFISFMQAELLKFQTTCRIMFDYYNMLEGLQPSKSTEKIHFLQFLKVPTAKVAVGLILPEHADDLVREHGGVQAGTLPSAVPGSCPGVDASAGADRPRDKHSTNNVLTFITQTGSVYSTDTSAQEGQQQDVPASQASAAAAAAAGEAGQVGSTPAAAESAASEAPQVATSTGLFGEEPQPADRVVRDVGAQAEEQVQIIYKRLEEKYKAPAVVHAPPVEEVNEKNPKKKEKPAKGGKGGKATPAKGRKGAESAVPEPAPVDPAAEKKAERVRKIRKEALANLEMEKERCMERLYTIQRNASTMMQELQERTEKVYTNIAELAVQMREAKKKSIMAAMELVEDAMERHEEFRFAMDITETELNIHEDRIVGHASPPHAAPSLCERAVPGVPLACDLEEFTDEMFAEQDQQPMLSGDVMDALERDVCCTVLPDDGTTQDKDWRLRALTILLSSVKPLSQSLLLQLADMLKSEDKGNSGYISHADFLNRFKEWLDGEPDGFLHAQDDDIDRMLDVTEFLFKALHKKGRLPYMTMILLLCNASTPLEGFVNMLAVSTGKKIDMYDDAAEIPLLSINKVITNPMISTCRGDDHATNLSMEDFKPELKDKAKKLKGIPDEIVEAYEEAQNRGRLRSSHGHSSLQKTVPLRDVLTHASIKDFLSKCRALLWLPTKLPATATEEEEPSEQQSTPAGILMAVPN
ncbi:sperm flagellar protein 2-like [Sycon ciliatum]|uniref:sperm flagellar protein 2-like n=1 Tax=Sycon ciliatum TaxID=27933 RepID=UPI0031F69542